MAALNGITGAGLIAISFSLHWVWLVNSPIWICLTAGVLLVVVILDLRSGRRRDWLHWLGMAYIGVSGLLAIARQVWLAMLPDVV